MLKNKPLMIEMALSRKYTASQIANATGYSRDHIARTIIALGIGKGRGIRNLWIFTSMTPELAYIIGAFITDGSITKSYRTHHIRGIQFSVTSKEFADRYGNCLTAEGFKTGRSIIPIRGKMTKIQYSVHCYYSIFARWLDSISQSKEHIPQAIFDSTQSCILAFLEGIIDGDGNVGKDGSIKVRSTKPWILDLPKLLDKIDIRHNQHIETTTNNKLYPCISIRRCDFRAFSPNLAVPQKQERLYNAKETRTERRPKRYKYKCPECGIERVTRKDAKRCEKCYRNSEQFQEHLRSISKKGNIAANIARWGTDHLHR